jgi:hypothetical protein
MTALDTKPTERGSMNTSRVSIEHTAADAAADRLYSGLPSTSTATASQLAPIARRKWLWS